MEATLTCVAASVPAGALLVGSIVSCFQRKTVASILQLMGAAFLMIAVIAQVCEALRLFPRMGWIDESIGFLELVSGLLGVVAFPLGCLLQAMHK
jgi:hypothetical protein